MLDPVGAVAIVLMIIIVILTLYIVTWFLDRKKYCENDPFCYLTCTSVKTYNENVEKINQELSNSSSDALDIIRSVNSSGESYFAKSSSRLTPIDTRTRGAPKLKCLKIIEFITENVKEGLSDIKSIALSVFGF